MEILINVLLTIIFLAAVLGIYAYSIGIRGVQRTQRPLDYSRAARRARSIARIQKKLDKGIANAQHSGFDPDHGERTNAS